MAPSARVTRGRSRTPSARVLRQLIVNARSLSKVAFTLLASFRGLAVSPRASFERLTLYHSRVIKQAVIFRVVFRSRPDLRCIEGHCGSLLLYFAGLFFRPPPCRSLASRLQSPWRTTLNLLCPSSLSPQPKTLKRPPWDAAGASDASFQGNLACLLLGYADGGLNLHVGGTEAPRSRPARMTVDLCAEDARSAKGIVMRGAAHSTRRLGAPRRFPNLT